MNRISNSTNMDVNEEVKKLGIQLGVAIAFHPFEYAKTLVQLGYEPFQPVETKRVLVGPPYLALPNILTYIKYMKSVDGFFGLYKGLTPRIMELIVGNMAYSTVARYSPIEQEEARGEQIKIIGSNAGVIRAHDQPQGEVKKQIKNTAWEIVCVSVRTVACHPFHVIAVKTMAQFVGRESVYTNPIQAMMQIWKDEGVGGFFSGLFPRLIGEAIYIVVTSSIMYAGAKFLANEKHGETICNISATILAGSLAYPFTLVSNMMTVNQSPHLAIGHEPFTRAYPNWISCWSDLNRTNQLKRGSSIFWRYYQGPTLIINGKLRPLHYHFGPIHMPKYVTHWD